MKRYITIFFLILAFLPSVAGNFSPEIRRAEIAAVCNAAARWQIDNFECKLHPLYWTNATLYRGMYAWGSIGCNQDCLDFIMELGEKNNWDMCYRTYHADDICVGQTFIEMYRRYGEEKMLRPARERAFWIASHPSDAPLDISDPRGRMERWSWADALFMAPPVYAALYSMTGEKIYADYLDSEYKACYESLYDKDEHLFYRDCMRFDLRESNGKKQFWARGNGWVFAGLTLVIDNLPENHPARNFYKQLYLEMAESIVKSQDENGAWHSSLLDDGAYPQPETSAGSFFCYGLAWGLNKGLLHGKTYKKALERSWTSLVGAVRADGLLGYVQPAGSAPGAVGPDSTEVFGVGAFLLAGSEVYKTARK